jgi:hypothetical protein
MNVYLCTSHRPEFIYPSCLYYNKELFFLKICTGIRMNYCIKSRIPLCPMKTGDNWIIKKNVFVGFNRGSLYTTDTVSIYSNRVYVDQNTHYLVHFSSSHFKESYEQREQRREPRKMMVNNRESQYDRSEL